MNNRVLIWYIRIKFMSIFQRYLYNYTDFSNDLFELNQYKYQLAILNEFSSNIDIPYQVDEVTVCAAKALHILPDTDKPVYGGDLYLAIEAIVESISKSILEFITKIINGFIELVDSSIDYQKDTIHHINQATNKLSSLYKDSSDYEDRVVKASIPDFHTFKVRIQSLFIFIRSAFKDQLQDIMHKDQLFGLIGDKSFDSYKDVISNEFTTELQTKLGLVYDDKVEKDKDPTEEKTSVESLRFVPPYNLPFEGDRSGKTIKALGYSDINDIIKFTKQFGEVILALCKELPELIDTCKSSKVVMEQILSKGSSDLDESKATKIVNTVSIWGNITESCIRAITYYLRTYLEILNVLYQTVAQK